jgi:hypothetical protein
MNSDRWYGFVVDVALSLERGPNGPRPLHEPPALYRPCYKIEHRNSVRYAVYGLHWILRGARWWSWHRYVLEEFFWAIGWMDGDDPEGPTLRSLRWGNPLRILEARVGKIRSAASEARDYAIKRAREEGADMTKQQLEELRILVDRFDSGRTDRLEKISRAGYEAHAASFGALQEISRETYLEGEVAEYSDVAAAAIAVLRMARFVAHMPERDLRHRLEVIDTAERRIPRTGSLDFVMRELLLHALNGSHISAAVAPRSMPGLAELEAEIERKR